MSNKTLCSVLAVPFSAGLALGVFAASDLTRAMHLIGQSKLGRRRQSQVMSSGIRPLPVRPQCAQK
ncbi:hypothetical protein SMICM17S_01106 [Streptomyces microflavus]